MHFHNAELDDVLFVDEQHHNDRIESGNRKLKQSFADTMDLYNVEINDVFLLKSNATLPGLKAEISSQRNNSPTKWICTMKTLMMSFLLMSETTMSVLKAETAS